MDATKSSAHRAPVDPPVKLARLEDRYRNEIMGEEERCEVRERILRIKRKAGRA